MKKTNHSVQHVVPRDKRGRKKVGGPVSAPFPAKAALIELRKALDVAWAKSFTAACAVDASRPVLKKSAPLFRMAVKLSELASSVDRMIDEGPLAGNDELSSGHEHSPNTL